MGAQAAKANPVRPSAAHCHGSHEGDESHESGKSHEGYESHEGEEGLRTVGKTSRLCWEIHENAEWPEEVRFGEKQVRQNCQQEEECPLQSQPMDCCLQGSAGGIEDQGVCRHQEGFPALQQGQGALQKKVILYGQRAGTHGSSTVDNTWCC